MLFAAGSIAAFSAGVLGTSPASGARCASGLCPGEPVVRLGHAGHVAGRALCAGLRATTAVLSRFWDWRAVSPFEDLSGELVITVRRRRSIFSLTPWGLPTGAARQMRGLEAAGDPAIGALASLIPARSWS